MISKSPITRVLYLTLFVLLFSIFSSDAHAQNKAINEAGAEQLKKVISNFIITQQNNFSGSAGKYISTGDLLVEPNGSYYAVTLPHLSYVLPGKYKIDLGIIAINALPDTEPGYWKMTMAIPTPISVYDQNNTLTGQLSIKNQNFAGIFHEDSNYFMNIRAGYEDIEIKDATKTYIKIPLARIYSDITDTNGLWSGPFNYSLKGFEVNLDPNSTMKIDEMNMNTHITDFSPAVAANFQTQLQAFLDSVDGNPNAISSQSNIGLLNLTTDYFQTAMDGFNVKMDIKGFALNLPLSRQNKVSKLNFDRTHFEFGMNEMKSNDMSMLLGFGYQGLDIQPKNPSTKDGAPTRLKYTTRMSRVPFKDIVALFKDVAANYIRNPQSGQMAGMQILFALPELLTQAGTTFEIADSHVGNDIYDAQLNAEFTANMKAAKGATGSGKLAIKGLEQMVNIANDNLNNSSLSRSEKQKIQQGLTGLTMLQLFGQQETNARGENIRIYDFELNAQGQTLLNGSDMNTLLGGQ